MPARWLLVLLIVILGCHPEPLVSDYVAPDVGDPLEATFDDPLLLTMAAARERTEYLVDEGYTFHAADDGTLAFVTDTAGDLGLAFDSGDLAVAQPSGGTSNVRLQHTTSDTLIATWDLDEGLAVELRFAAATSRTAFIEAWLRNDGAESVHLTAIAWLRRCDGGYQRVGEEAGSLTAEHGIEISEEEQLFAPGTWIDHAADRLTLEGGLVELAWRQTCTDRPGTDLADLSEGPDELPGTVAVIALTTPIEVPAGTEVPVRAWRALAPEEEGGMLAAEVTAAADLSMVDLVEAGHDRLAAVPDLPGVDSERDLVVRSAFTLLDQLMMPAEGDMPHPYYVFSREPTWWFARLGQHAHESLSLITLAQLDCDLATQSHRNLLDRVEADGYLPYNVGPVVTTDTLGTATAPFLSYVSWELAQACDDADFLAEAYAAGARVHDFWVEQRDRDGDGLAEFGGFAVSEATRDLNNVVWDEVAAPDEVEAVDLNSWLVMEARTLATMADALGESAEAAAWEQTADARAALIDEAMWDEETGFYYHVHHDDNDFEVAEPGDLKRMEIAGFMPLWAGIAQGDRADSLLQHLADEDRFWREFGIPSLAADDPSYDPEASSCCRWNGPVWVQWQFLLMRALLDHGEHERAGQLADRVYTSVTAQLAETHQFRELYDPDEADADNLSMPNYIWTAMVAQLLLETGP